MWMGSLHPSSEATSAWISFCVHLRSSAVKPPFLGAIPVRDRRSKDRLSRERRSWNMSRIRGRDTTPEKRVRSVLHRLGFRFRLHVRIPASSPPLGERAGVRAFTPSPPLEEKVPGGRLRGIHSLSPTGGEGWGEGARTAPKVRRRTSRAISVDVLLPKYKTAIFVHGCFWHRHRGCKNCTTPTHRREWWLAKLEGNAGAFPLCLERGEGSRVRCRFLGQLIIGKFTAVGAPPRFSDGTLEHAGQPLTACS